MEQNNSTPSTVQPFQPHYTEAYGAIEEWATYRRLWWWNHSKNFILSTTCSHLDKRWSEIWRLEVKIQILLFSETLSANDTGHLNMVNIVNADYYRSAYGG